MKIDPGQLNAVAAVLRSGSFEKAAQRLSVTPSAISQRVKVLEEQLGVVLIVRGLPCHATPAGSRILRHAEEVALLERSLSADIGGADHSEAFPTVRIAVNADSLATWLVPAMAASGDLLFDLQIDDQDHSAHWLRHGDVRAAISADEAPVQGCDCVPLGTLSYRATASPEFMARWFSAEVTLETLLMAPAMIYNSKDNLQSNWMKQTFGHEVSPPCHWLASTHAFVDAAVAGLGWGMNPEPLVRDLIKAGDLVELVPDASLSVPLYWHVSRSASKGLVSLTDAVRKAGREYLQPLEA
ncbi:LysR family transcriptional regulator ArgP [Roseibium algae]|uniref:LysR family transcriptional regulator ArgP n=1 Tax=Roseibium algae TaxID=3123038 RepID=A0ABU8TER4_9HYPH